jgi:DNA-binding NarL/FixJ family response regulator
MNSRTTSEGTQKKVLIVDDHPLLREGLSIIINQHEGLQVCAQAGDAPSGMAAVAKFHPDIVIVDISLAEGSGLDLIKDLYALDPKLPVLALSMHDEHIYAERARCAGVKGCVRKHEPPDAVIKALCKILNGQLAISENIISQLLSRRFQGDPSVSRAPVDLLSDRELEIYRCLGSGQGTRAIAAKLSIAVSTVESYRASIKQKLNLKNSTDLISSAAKFVVEESTG